MMPIGTLIHDFLAGVDRTDLIRQHGLGQFRVQVLCVERTLCEKIMGLVRASHEADPIAEFHGNFKDMVYGDPVPTDEEVLSCLASIGVSLTRV